MSELLKLVFDRVVEAVVDGVTEIGLERATERFEYSFDTEQHGDDGPVGLHVTDKATEYEWFVPLLDLMRYEIDVLGDWNNGYEDKHERIIGEIEGALNKWRAAIQESREREAERATLEA